MIILGANSELLKITYTNRIIDSNEVLIAYLLFKILNQYEIILVLLVSGRGQKHKLLILKTRCLQCYFKMDYKSQKLLQS